MELKLRNNNTIECDDEELELIRKSMDYYTQYVAFEKSKGKDYNHPDMIESMKYEELCQSLEIDGYQFS